MAVSTYDDVNLILKLYDMRREEKLRAARAWFVQSFHARTLEELNKLCPTGSEENARFRQVTTYWEMVASFMTAGVLHRELFFQSGSELLLVWERLRDLMPALRESRKNPAAYENLETVARDFAVYMNARHPGSYEAFSKRVRGD
jgi:hypothetical protein